MQVAKILARKGATSSPSSPTRPSRSRSPSSVKRRVGALIVSSDGTTVAGIVSERDVVRRLAELGPPCWSSPSRRS